MRILALSTWFPFPPDNGSKIRAYYLLQALARRHEVTLIAFNLARVQPEHINHPDLLPAVLIQSIFADPYRDVKLPTWRAFISPVPLAYRRNRMFETRMRNTLAQGNWDCIVAIQTPVARYALQDRRYPALLDVDTSLSYQMYERRVHAPKNVISQARTWGSYQKAFRYESRLFKQFAACTVVSSTEINHLARLVAPSGRAVLIQNGVDCQHNTLGLTPKSPNTLVYNGALTYDANYDAMQYFLAEIYPIIKAEISDVTLSITGSTQGVNLSGLKLDDSVFLTGYVEDVRPPVATSTACIIPIRQGGGTRLKILEAMALGTPVVSTSKGAEGLDLTPGEHLLTADNPRAFAAQVIRLLRQPDLQQRLARQARQRVEREYDWQKIGQRFVDLVEDIAGAG
jgi:glycosyltransferase involved in cell wall biosynthesis